MASNDGRMEEAIRGILESGEETTRGWSDEQVIAEARKRAGDAADATDDATDRWTAVIAEMRSATDNDGQTRA